MQLTKKSFSSQGQEIVVTLVKMGSDEGMFNKDLASMLGIEEASVRGLISRHGLIAAIDNEQILLAAKKQGLVSNMVVRLNLVPRDTVKALVKIVNTPEAWAAYNYLWEVAENPMTAVEHYKAMGIELSKDRLLPEQVTVLNGLIEVALRRYNVNPMAQWTYESKLGVTKESGPKSRVIMAIRERFLPTNSSLAWKEIERRYFDKVVEFINAWKPSEKDDSMFKWKKAYLPPSEAEKKAIRRANDIRDSQISEAKLLQMKAKKSKARYV